MNEMARPPASDAVRPRMRRRSRRSKITAPPIPSGKRIVIVSHSHPRLRAGGGEIAAYRQFRHLLAVGEDAYFVGCTVGGDGARLMGPLQQAIFFEDRDICVRGDGMSGFDLEHSDPENEERLLELLRSLDAEVYHFHHMWNIGVGTIRRLKASKPGAKFVFTIHEMVAICANHGQMVRTTGELCHGAGPVECSACLPQHGPLAFLIRRQRMRELFDLFDVLISPSHFLRTRFEEWGIAPGRIHVLENGLDHAGAAAEESCDDEFLSRRFAFFGNATPTKGLNVLVRAARLLSGPDDATALRIEVNGCTQADFEALWPDIEVPQNVVFNGRYRPQDATALMARSGWIVIPSTWWENSPVVIEEAKAARRPMIGSDIGGMREKIGGWGLTFPVGDAEALASLMSRVGGDAEQLGASRERVPAFTTTAGFDAEWRRMCGI